MKRLLPLLVVCLIPHTVMGADVKVQYRVTGLFQPDRVDDLRRLVGTLMIKENNAPTDIKLADVDYHKAIATFQYDPESNALKNKNSEQIREWLSNQLRHLSRGSFDALPLSTLKDEQLQNERIGVAGLDCKGCAYGAYRAIAPIDGVERAVVDFKEGHVTAWIDPTRTNREVLVQALIKAQVHVITTKDHSDNQKSNP